MEENPVIAKVRRAALQRGVHGVRSMGRAFRIMNDNNNDERVANSRTTIGREEAATGLANWGLALTDAELNELFACADATEDGRLDVDEFFRVLRGGMGERRRRVVDTAFDCFDSDGSGVVNLDDVRAAYQGERESCDSFLALFDSKSNPDGRVTRAEMHDYYAGLSAGIDNDEHFELLVQRAWGLPEAGGEGRVGGGGSGQLSQSTAGQYATFGEGCTYQRFYTRPERVACYLDLSAEGFGTERVSLELYTDICPLTCENFRALCTGDRGNGLSGQPLHYKGTSMHRVTNGKFLQGGDVVRDNGKGSDSIYGRKFKDENFSVKHDKPFMLTMANTGPNSNGSQFCITLKALPYLDGRNVAFGRVLDNGEWVQHLSTNCASDSGKTTRRIEIVDCGVY